MQVCCALLRGWSREVWMDSWKCTATVGLNVFVGVFMSVRGSVGKICEECFSVSFIALFVDLHFFFSCYFHFLISLVFLLLLSFSHLSFSHLSHLSLSHLMFHFFSHLIFHFLSFFHFFPIFFLISSFISSSFSSFCGYFHSLIFFSWV